MDSFLFKLSGVSKSVSFSDNLPVNSVVAAPVSDLLMVAVVPSSLTLDERGIIVYLAGYLGTKTKKTYGCLRVDIETA